MKSFLLLSFYFLFQPLDIFSGGYYLGITDSADEKHQFSYTSLDPETDERISIYRELVKRLANELGYKGSILIEFKNHMPPTENKFFLSNELVESSLKYKNTEKRRKKGKEASYKIRIPRIIIRHFSEGKEDIISILKLLEYAILNEKLLKDQQQDTIFTGKRMWQTISEDTGETKEELSEYEYKTLPQENILRILESPSGQILTKVINTRVERSEPVGDITYYWQNGYFHLCFIKRHIEDIIYEATVYSTENISRIEYLYSGAHYYLIFTDTSSFVCITRRYIYDSNISRVQTLPYKPTTIANMGRDEIWFYSNRMLISLKEEDYDGSRFKRIYNGDYRAVYDVETDFLKIMPDYKILPDSLLNLNY